MPNKKKHHILRNILLMIGGAFVALVLIAIFAPEPPAEPAEVAKVEEAVPPEEPKQEEPQKAQSFFYSVLHDANFPKMYKSTREDFILYFDKNEHKNWLNYEFAHNEETSHFHITERRRGVTFEKYVWSISISDKQNEAFSEISLFEAIRIGERFLPSTPPPVRKDYTRTIPERITWTRTFERVYFIPGNDYLETENEIIYTSKLLSNEKIPEAFYSAININIKADRIQTITIDIMQYDPPRLQKTYKLKNEIINNFDALIEILNNGVEAESFIEYQE
jgi:hypothetical protein